MKKTIYSVLVGILMLTVACGNKNQPVVTIAVSPNITPMTVGDMMVFTAQVSGSSDAVVWSSSDPKILEVSDGGVVKAIDDGTAYVYASIGESRGEAKVLSTHPGGVYRGEYSLVWSDEFEGNALNTDNWQIQTGGGGWGNQEKQYYTDRPENIRVKDGCLEIEARKEEYSSNHYTSARLQTKGKKDFAYGKIEARISMPNGRGVWPAFWMLGNGSWPTCGEIDIMEYAPSLMGATKVSHAVHTREKNGSNGKNWSSRTEVGDATEFHVYGVEWIQTWMYGCDAIRFTVDGEYKALITQAGTAATFESWPFTKPEFILLNMAIGGTMGSTINDDIFNNPVVMKVDWVRVYQKPM